MVVRPRALVVRADPVDSHVLDLDDGAERLAEVDPLAEVGPVDPQALDVDRPGLVDEVEPAAARRVDGFAVPGHADLAADQHDVVTAVDHHAADADKGVGWELDAVVAVGVEAQPARRGGDPNGRGVVELGGRPGERWSGLRPPLRVLGSVARGGEQEQNRGDGGQSAWENRSRQFHWLHGAWVPIASPSPHTSEQRRLARVARSAG